MGKSGESILLRMLYANTEEVVQSIIDGDAAMRDDRNWYPVDERVTNFNVVSNQSSNGAKAATEMITNMVDAMLTKYCLESDINPKSADAPPSMYRAVDKFVRQMGGGKILNEDAAWLRNYASENLVIGVTGSRKGEIRPCYTFCDNGEGQHPDEFINTFLSMSAKNKSEIPFVQGKYNMGSSGVLNFCGLRWFKLIVSRRYDKSGSWGWTLIRKNESGSGMPYAEYFAPHNKIPRIDDDRMYPFKTYDGKRYDEFSLDAGSIIKLYEYYVGKSHSGFRATREAFNENLVETILPFRIFDFRQTPSPKRGGGRALGVDPRPFYGMEFLLARSHGEEDGGESEVESVDNKILDIGTELTPELGKITVTAIAIKKQSSQTGWIKGSNYRIFHHVNGQAHYKQTRGFLTQCRLPALKDRVVIFVDASHLLDRAHQNIWKADRQSILESRLGEEYIATVKALIQGSSVLKELNHKITAEEVDSVAKDSSRELVKELVASDKNLALLLDAKLPDAPVPPSQRTDRARRNDLKYSPTYIKIKGKSREMEVPINRTRPIACETNAVDDFFVRADNRGSAIFGTDDAADKFRLSHTLDNGELALFIRPDASVNVGDVFRFNIGLIDEAMPQPVFTEEITVRIVHPARRDAPPPPPPPPPPPSRAGLPSYKLLTSDGRDLPDGTKTQKWEDANCANFGKHDGGYVHDLGDEGKQYCINYDNASFKSYLHDQKRDADKKAVSEKYILGMRILMLGLEHALSSATEEMKEHEDPFRRLAARGAASVILTLCEQLPKHFDLFKDEKGDDEEG